MVERRALNPRQYRFDSYLRCHGEVVSADNTSVSKTEIESSNLSFPAMGLPGPPWSCSHLERRGAVDAIKGVQFSSAPQGLVLDRVRGQIENLLKAVQLRPSPISECSSVWKSACPGHRRSKVQFLSLGLLGSLSSHLTVNQAADNREVDAVGVRFPGEPLMPAKSYGGTHDCGSCFTRFDSLRW